jgi:hypothetical protein
MDLYSPIMIKIQLSDREILKKPNRKPQINPFNAHPFYATGIVAQLLGKERLHDSQPMLAL